MNRFHNAAALAVLLATALTAAAPYFGQEMKDAAVLLRNARRGSVILGPLRVVEDDEPLPTPSN